MSVFVESYQPQWIELSGVVNMRDLGGMPTKDGGAIQLGRLIRADNLQDLSGTDVDRLIALGLSDVVDLRSRAELASTGPGPLRDRTEIAHHFNSLLVDWDHEASAAEALAADEAAQEPSSLDDDSATDTPEDGIDQTRAGYYLDYLRLRPDSVSASLAVLASARGATVVHCAAGKDRTGTVVALALDVAGVPEHHIVTDYARSAERIEAILTRLQGEAFYAADPNTYRVADQTPRAQTMRHFLAVLQERHDGAAGWLRSNGWSSRDIAGLRDSLRAT